MKEIQKHLFEMQDVKYRDLQIRIIKTVNPEKIIGVRTPDLKRYAKELIKEDYSIFLNELPHDYFDENQLHAFIISKIKDYDECLNCVNSFLPYIDNWATCDQLLPKVFKKNTDKLLKEIKVWTKSKDTYVVRFGINMLMQYYLDYRFKPEYLDLVSKIKSNEYYVNMMIAWFFATALAKKYDYAVKYLEENVLDTWTHNKTIQKAIESYRITDSQKEYLRSLKKK